MSNLKQTIQPLKSIEFNVVGGFFRLMASSGLVEVVFYRNGAEVVRSGEVKAGYAERVAGGFTSFRITDVSNAENAVEAVYRDSGDVRYDRVEGDVSILGDVGVNIKNRDVVKKSFTTFGGTCAATAASLIDPAINRSFLMIQNNSATAALYVWFGVATTTANAMKIAPGDRIVFDSVVPQNNMYIGCSAVGAIWAVVMAATPDPDSIPQHS